MLCTRHAEFSFGGAGESVARPRGEGMEIKEQRVVERPSLFKYVRVDEHESTSPNDLRPRANSGKQIPSVCTRGVVQRHETHLSKMQRLCPRQHVETEA